MVVPGGGLSPDGSKWIACRPRYFLTVQVLSALFRRLFLEMLVATHHAGRLQFFGDHARLADEAGPGRCCGICHATPTASRSPIAGCCPPTRTASPSSTRTIGSRGPPATKR